MRWERSFCSLLHFVETTQIQRESLNKELQVREMLRQGGIKKQLIKLSGKDILGGQRLLAVAGDVRAPLIPSPDSPTTGHGNHELAMVLENHEPLSWFSTQPIQLLGTIFLSLVLVRGLTQGHRLVALTPSYAHECVSISENTLGNFTPPTLRSHVLEHFFQNPGQCVCVCVWAGAFTDGTQASLARRRPLTLTNPNCSFSADFSLFLLRAHG